MSDYSALDSLRELEQLLAKRRITASMPMKSLSLLYEPSLEHKKKSPMLKMAQAAKHAIKTEKVTSNKDSVINRVIDRNFQLRTIQKDFETAVGLELLIEAVYSRKTVLLAKDGTVQPFSCQTALLNLLLSIARPVDECKKVQISILPYTLHLTNKHLAKRNTKNSQKYIVQSKDIGLTRDIEIREDHPPLGQYNSDRAKISMIKITSSRTKNKSHKCRHRRYLQP